MNNSPGWNHTHTIAAATTANFKTTDPTTTTTNASGVMPANGVCGSLSCDGLHPHGAAPGTVAAVTGLVAGAVAAAVTTIPAATGAAQ